MEPEEKAKGLVARFSKIEMCMRQAKQCAFMVVEEILFAFEHGFAGIDQSDVGPDIIYWQKVKQAIKDIK